MASTSYAVVTPSEVRRRRAARFSVSPLQDYEAPSFSLGIEIEPVRSLPSFDDECAQTNPRQDDKSWEKTSGRIDIDDEDDTDDRVVKRSPISSRTCDTIANNENGRSRVSTWNEPLPHVGNTRAEVVEDVEILNSFGSRLDSLDDVTCLPPDSSRKRVLKRLKRGPSVVCGESTKRPRVSFLSSDVPKYSSEREGDNRVGTSFSKDSASRDEIEMDRKSRTVGMTNRAEVDEIEDFSDDELFGYGSQNKPGRRSTQPQKVENDTILISSSPEMKKPILHIPGLDGNRGFPKIPFKLSQPTAAENSVTEDDTLCPQKSQSPSDSTWRSTRPLVGRSVQMCGPSKKTSSDSQRANSMQQVSQSSQPELARTIQTQTPMKRDIVGASRTFRGADSQPEENEIWRFLRQRLPHYKPVDAIMVDGGLHNEPVYIDYRNQFVDCKGSSVSQVKRSGTSIRPTSTSGTFSSTPLSANFSQRRTGGKKRFAATGQPRKQVSGRSSSASGNARARSRGQKGSGDGHWTTVNGTKVYVVAGSKLTGRSAYSAYKGRGKSSKRKGKKSGAESEKRAAKSGKRYVKSEK